MAKKSRSEIKECFVCGVQTDQYHTVQAYASEPYRTSIAEIDIVLCDETCYPKLRDFLKILTWQ